MLRFFKAFCAVLFVVGCYYLIKWMIGSISVYPVFNLPEHLLESKSWVLTVEHHTIQLLLALIAIGITSRGHFREWGLNVRNRKESFAILKKFCYYYIVYFLGFSFIIQILNYPEPPFEHPFTAFYVTGRLLYGFILTGLSEEILFRGFIHTFLALYITGVWKWKSVEMPVAGFVATIIFTIAHIGFSISPFDIWHLNPLQLVQAFVLGLFYSWAYHRTGSLLAPILAHNISNGSLWTMDYILFALKG